MFILILKTLTAIGVIVYLILALYTFTARARNKYTLYKWIFYVTVIELVLFIIQLIFLRSLTILLDAVIWALICAISYKNLTRW